MYEPGANEGFQSKTHAMPDDDDDGDDDDDDDVDNHCEHHDDGHDDIDDHNNKRNNDVDDARIVPASLVRPNGWVRDYRR